MWFATIFSPNTSTFSSQLLKYYIHYPEVVSKTGNVWFGLLNPFLIHFMRLCSLSFGRLLGWQFITGIWGLLSCPVTHFLFFSVTEDQYIHQVKHFSEHP
jgi:hypothetical protein